MKVCSPLSYLLLLLLWRRQDSKKQNAETEVETKKQDATRNTQKRKKNPSFIEKQPIETKIYLYFVYIFG